MRGVAFEAIGKQIGITKQAAHLLYKKALKLTPKADVEEMRKLEAERIPDLRQRLWSELGGRPDPNDPTKTIRPAPEVVISLVNRAVRLSRHEAMIFGMDEPTKSQIVWAFVGQAISEEELEALCRECDAILKWAPESRPSWLAST